MSNVKITFLGTGDAVNSGGRAHQSILLESSNFRLLVDCGANTLLRFQQLGLNPDSIDAVLFTHFHADHFLGLANFDLSLVFNFLRKREIIYVGPVGLQQRCERLFKLSYPTVYPSEYSEKFLRQIEEYDANKSYILADGKVNIDTFPMQHSSESLGYRISMEGKQISITGDTQWHDGIIDLAKGSDILICESFHFKKPDPCIGHCSYEEIEEYKEKLETNQIILIHGSSDLLKNKEKVLIPVAEDGQVIEL